MVWKTLNLGQNQRYGLENIKPWTESEVGLENIKPWTESEVWSGKHKPWIELGSGPELN